MGQAATLQVVGIISEVDLHPVVNTAGDLGLLFRPQTGQQIGLQSGMLIKPFRFNGIIRDIPGFADDKCAFNAAVGAVIPDASFRQSPASSHFSNGYITHGKHLSCSCGTNIICRYRQYYKDKIFNSRSLLPIFTINKAAFALIDKGGFFCGKRD